ncbi:MAG: hypothetical protein E7030_07785 [Akkermansiaceae bacterium]|nr:hypothetical protein [Akkermansiaceae bacterium]
MDNAEKVSYEIDRDALTAAIVELNSMSPADGVIMTRGGEVRTGYVTEPDFLCMLIPAGVLARQLTADGLSSYTGKELKKWAGEYAIEPLQEKVTAALAIQ